MSGDMSEGRAKGRSGLLVSIGVALAALAGLGAAPLLAMLINVDNPGSRDATAVAVIGLSDCCCVLTSLGLTVAALVSAKGKRPMGRAVAVGLIAFVVMAVITLASFKVMQSGAALPFAK